MDPTEKGVWWKDDTQWVIYPPEIAAEILRANKKGDTELTLGPFKSPRYPSGTSYAIDLLATKQKNLNTGFSRDIKIVSASSDEEDDEWEEEVGNAPFVTPHINFNNREVKEEAAAGKDIVSMVPSVTVDLQKLSSRCAIDDQCNLVLYLRSDDYNEGGSGCCCTRCCPPCLRCFYDTCAPNAEEQDSSSSVQGVSSSVSAGLLVGASLDTSIPDTYRAPPTPLPYDADVRYARTGCDGLGARNDRSGPIQSRDSQHISGNVEGEGEALAAFENLKSAEFKSQMMDSKPSSPGTCQASKLSEMVTLTDEEETCPTCLEEYDKENPRIITKCDHHFHLACILEWMERSDNCPICDQEMIFNEKPLDA